MADVPEDPTTIAAKPRPSRSRLAFVAATMLVIFGAGGLVQADAGAQPVAAAAVFVAVAPCRLTDTRPAPQTVGSRATPLGTNSTLTISVIGPNGNCNLPADASTIVMNTTVTDMTADSFLTVYSAGQPRPATSTMNWTAITDAIANAVTVNVSASGEITFYNLHGTVDIVADVVGYYTSAPLADFYTKSQVDALLAAHNTGVGSQGPAGPPGADGDVGSQGPAGSPGAAGDSVLASLHCTTDQVIRYDGTAWACSTDQDTLAGLQCTAGQSVGYNGAAWVCRSAPIVATLSRPAFSGCCGLESVFPSHSPDVTAPLRCDFFNCSITLLDVPDHTACSVNFTGNVQSNNINVILNTGSIQLNQILNADPSQPLYVTITCNV